MVDDVKPTLHPPTPCQEVKLN